MAYFYPCKNCAFEKVACEKRDAMRASLKGLGVTSVKFKCALRRPLFEPGQRVCFEWTLYHGGDDIYHDVTSEKLVFRGTVAGEAKRGLRVTVRVDQHHDSYDYDPKEIFQNGGDAVNVKPSDLSKLAEPARAMCPSCLKYEGETGRCQAHFGRGWDRYVPDGCFDAKATTP